MSMRVNAGVSRKIGLPNFSSVGASCNLELELGAGLLGHDLDAFRAQVRAVYAAAYQAVQDELALLQSEPTTIESAGSLAVRRSFPGQPSHGGRSIDPPTDRTRPAKPATERQIRAIRTIARREGVDLAGLLIERYAVQRPDDLNLDQASHLIDRLNVARSS